MGTLYIVATPIGNLADISARALETLRQVSVIFAEDTRVTAKLLQSHDIATPTRVYHQHSAERVVAEAVQYVRDGDDIALVSDAGTPGINDPGGALIAQVLQEVPDASIVPIPGANAAVTALSVSGFPAERYRYLGFVPHKKGRQTFFRTLAECGETQVFYESKHRIIKSLEQMGEAFAAADRSDRRLMVARELTKRFETLYRGTSDAVLQQLLDGDVLGEFVVVVGPYGR